MLRMLWSYAATIWTYRSYRGSALKLVLACRLTQSRILHDWTMFLFGSVFSESTERECFGLVKPPRDSWILYIRNSFCEASGEKVSLAKSQMLVSKNIPHNQATVLSSQCGILGKDLGAPMINGRVTKNTYGTLLSNTQARFNSWANKHLSIHGG